MRCWTRDYCLAPYFAQRDFRLLVPRMLGLRLALREREGKGRGSYLIMCISKTRSGTRNIEIPPRRSHLAR